MNKIKPEDIQVGARFQHQRLADDLIEIDRVVGDYVLAHCVEQDIPTTDQVAIVIPIKEVIELYKPITEKIDTRRIMKARRSNSLIEVKLVSNEHALIVNLDSQMNEIEGTERIVREDSLIKSYKPS